MSSFLVLFAPLLLLCPPPSLAGQHDSMLTQFFQFKDATRRINSFSNLVKNSINTLDQIVHVLERQFDGNGSTVCWYISYEPQLVSLLY